MIFIQEFHKSYTLKNEECDQKSLNKFYEQDSSEFEIQRESGNQRRREQKSWFDSEEESRTRSDEERYGSGEEQNKQNRRQPIKKTKVIGESC